MENESKDEMPFRESIEIINWSGSFVNVGELVSNDKLVVKELMPNEKVVCRSLPCPYLEIQESVSILQSYLKRLEHDFPREFAQFIPKTQLVIGKNNDGKETLFVVQEKIIGATLKKYEAGVLHKSKCLLDDEEQKTQVKEIIRMLVKFYLKTFDSKINAGQTLEIANLNNYMIGRKASETDAKESIFLIDTVPLYFSGPFTVMSEINQAVRIFSFDGEYFADLLVQLEALEKDN